MTYRVSVVVLVESSAVLNVSISLLNVEILSFELCCKRKFESEAERTTESSADALRFVDTDQINFGIELVGNTRMLVFASGREM